MSKFRIDQIQHYVWALSKDWPSMPGGYDAENNHKMLKKMADGYKDTVQADIDFIDRKIEKELELDARHQQHFWLWIDRAIEAVGMLEADGLDIGKRGKIFANHYYDAHKKGSNKSAFISLVKPNIELYKSQIQQSDVIFEAAPNSPRQDAQAIADFNLYKTEILNQNHFQKAEDNVIHDMAAYGSGCYLVDHQSEDANPDDMFFEDRVRNGEVIDFEDYMQAQRMIKSHVIDYIDTFEVIAHRNAAGRGSWNIAGSPQHPYVHWVRQERVARMKRKFPHIADRIKARTSDVYRQTNPKSFVTDYNDEDQVTVKTTWIRFPVSYDMTVKVRLSNGDIVNKLDHKNRSAVCRVDRIEGVGVVDMELDRFAHNLLPICQAVNTPSMKHSRGIGMCKYGYAPQKVHQIMFNGQLRMFERMVKGGGWFFKDVISRKEVKEQQKEGSWIGIDRDDLPADLKNAGIDQLVSQRQPMQFPAVYDQMQGQTERYVNTAMSAPPVSKGHKAGTSGRQDMALINQSDQVTSGGIRSYEAVMMPLGKQLHANIVKFDGKRMNLEFVSEDPARPGHFRKVVLNNVVHEQAKFDPYAPEDSMYSQWTLVPTLIKNNLRTLQYTTQLSTRSLLPSNPTERRLYLKDFVQNLALPLTETKRGIEILKWMVESGLGGMPGFDERIKAIEKSIDEDRKHQAAMASKEDQREQKKLQLEAMAKQEELAQNLRRLEHEEDESKREMLIDTLEALIDAAESDKQINVDRLLQKSQATSNLQI